LKQSRQDAGWSWSIGVVALALLVVAIVEFVRPGSGETVDLSAGPTGTQLLARAGTSLAHLHQLLPDASADLGRPVQVAGTILGQASDTGVWVRDLYENVVFIAHETPGLGSSGQREAGRTVRVRGTVALFPPAEQVERLRAAGLVLPAGTVVVRDIKIRATEGTIEVLSD
jgi:hypothetical protein